MNNRILAWVLGAATAVQSALVSAAGIPGALTPPTTASTTGLIDTVKNFFKDWLPVVGYAIIGIILIGVVWYLFAKYTEVNTKKATWGEFLMTGIIGALVALLAGLFVSLATGIF